MKKIINTYSELPKDTFKWILVTFSFGYLPFLILQIILTLFEIFPVNFNNQDTYGIKGAIVLILFSPFIVIIMSFSVWVYIIFGNWVLKTLKKIL